MFRITNHTYIRRTLRIIADVIDFIRALSLLSDTTALEGADSRKSANSNSTSQSFKIHLDENSNKLSSTSKPLQEWKSLPNSNKAIKENSKALSKWNQQKV